MLAAPSGSHAFKTSGRWFKNTVPYYNAAPGYAKEVRAAARAWNESGARIRWVEVSRRKARVIIRTDAELYDVEGALGQATAPNGRRLSRGSIKILPPGVFRQRLGLDTLEDSLPVAGFDRIVRGFMTRAFVHEMGHVMGLLHDDRQKCATMTSRQFCLILDPGVRGRWYCRMLEPDDVAGAIRIYGGGPRPLPPQYCDFVRPPAAATELAVDEGPAGETVSWLTPADSSITSIVVSRRLDTCPQGVRDPSAETFGELTYVQPNTRESLTVPPPDASGRYCYAVFTVNDYTGSTRVTLIRDFTVPAPEELPQPEQLPPPEELPPA